MSEAFSDPLPPLFDEDLPVDKRKCRLLGPTALVVQALMGVLVILSLVYKRHRESPKRPWRIWAFDVSKQVVGQMFIHGMNLLISGVGAHHAASNPCALYFLNILIDTTLGVALIYFIHHFLTHVFSSMLQLKGFISGQYGSPPSVLYWIRQAAVYVTALSIMKVIVIGLFAIWPGIVKVGDWLLSWTGGGDGIQVIFVMGLFPIAMNVLQFWLIDSIVKAASQETEVLPDSSPRHSADREPLFNSLGSDDEDDGQVPRHGSDIENTGGAGSSSQSTRSKATLDEEQKYLSSRTSVDEPGVAERAHAHPPQSSSPGSSTQSCGRLNDRPASPMRSGRSPAGHGVLESTPCRKNVDLSANRAIAAAENLVTGRRIAKSPGVTYVELSTFGNKPTTRDGRGDWTLSIGKIIGKEYS